MFITPSGLGWTISGGYGNRRADMAIEEWPAIHAPESRHRIPLRQAA
jgi:hypothetical protein